MSQIILLEMNKIKSIGHIHISGNMKYKKIFENATNEVYSFLFNHKFENRGTTKF